MYVENPEESTHKLLALINELGKVTGYKDNLQKYVVFNASSNKTKF